MGVVSEAYLESWGISWSGVKGVSGRAPLVVSWKGNKWAYVESRVSLVVGCEGAR